MSTEAEIATFLEKYSPEIAAQLRSARAKLQALFPRGCELVYDNYNALVFCFGPTDRASDAVLSIAGYPKWVTLFFAKGRMLQDPALGEKEGDPLRVAGDGQDGVRGAVRGAE